ncbi:hypothetical protein ACP70R_007647 [Stipagrostis hirtigluma subsp. patula]
MGLRGIRDIVASLFIMLNKDTYILFRVEFLVVVVTVLFLAMFIMDIFRRHFHSRFMKAMFHLFDAASDFILVYLLGAMQTAPFKNELFPVWALVLVIFRYSVGFISGYGAPDHGGKHFTEFRNGMNLLWTLILNLTHGSRFLPPLLSLLALQMLRSLYTFTSHILANNSYWHGRSSELISEYMRADRSPSNWKPKECNPGTMDGYKYLVYGESRVRLQKPQYALYIDNSSSSSQKKDSTPPTQLPRREVQQGRHSYAQEQDTSSSKIITRSSLITLDKIWGCRRHLLHPNDNSEGADNTQAKDLKDHSLAFALSRLLRARLEDVTLQEDIRSINRNLVKARIIEERDDERAIGIMDLQLAFVNDYFHTRYPMVFWSGLGSLLFSLLQSLVTISVVAWLSVDIHKVYKPPNGDLAHVVQGFNVDMIITWTFLLFLIFKEIWEIVTYLLSDWTRLLLVCMYARWNDEHVRDRLMERLMLCFFKSKIKAKRWHKHLDQYFFLQSYDDRPKFCNFIHTVTTGMLPKKDDGAKLSHAIDVPKYVRYAALEKLRAIMDQRRHCSKDLPEPSADAHRNLKERTNTDSCVLPKVITTLGTCGRKERYGWACFNLQTSSHVILVWHIATSLCEMALAMKHGVDLSKPRFLSSLVSCFTGCCSSKPYLIDVSEQRMEKNKEKLMEGDGVHSSNSGFMHSLLSCFTGCCPSKANAGDKYKLTEELRKRYIIANSLSRYCAYLLVSKPDLIPDSFLVPKMVFQSTVRSARDDILEGCDSLESRYNKLKEEVEKAAGDYASIKTGNDVVRQGAVLGKELLDHEGREGCWEILSGVWAELLVHMAPTWNAEAHKKCLKSGGECITNIWALLWHCGIEKSSLWPADDASEDNAPAAPQDNDAGNNKNINNLAKEAQQATEDGSDDLTEIKIHKVDEIEVTEEPEAQLEDWTKGSTGTSFEIGESSRDRCKCSDMGGLENPEQERSRG